MVDRFAPDRVHPARFGTVLFGLGLLLCLLGAPHPAQGAATCRANPLITFSSGLTVNLHLQVSDVLSDIKHIDYVLHGPPLVSTSMAHANPAGSTGWYTSDYPDGTGPISDLTYVADSKPNHYYAVVTVTSGSQAVPVVVYLDWTAGRVDHAGTARVSGISAQAIQTPVLFVMCGHECEGNGSNSD